MNKELEVLKKSIANIKKVIIKPEIKPPPFKKPYPSKKGSDTS